MLSILVVDEHDRPVGEFPKEDVWARGLLHRIVRVMVEDEQGRILLQRRSATVDTFPDCWDHSAAGHVDAGEDYDDAARRELSEELGIHDVALHRIATYHTNDIVNGRILNRFNALYQTVIDSSLPLHIAEDEVSAVRWFSREELQRLVSKQPHDVTDGLAQVATEYYGPR